VDGESERRTEFTGGGREEEEKEKPAMAAAFKGQQQRCGLASTFTGLPRRRSRGKCRDGAARLSSLVTL
jgi:hypothetical protein